MAVDRLHDGEDPRPHIEALLMTLNKATPPHYAPQAPTASLLDPVRHIRRLQAELDDLSQLYFAIPAQPYDQRASLRTLLGQELGGCASAVLQMAIKNNVAIDDTLAASWLVTLPQGRR